MEDKQLVPLIWQAVTLHIGSNSPKKIIPLIHFYQCSCSEPVAVMCRSLDIETDWSQ